MSDTITKKKSRKEDLNLLALLASVLAIEGALPDKTGVAGSLAGLDELLEKLGMGPKKPWEKPPTERYSTQDIYPPARPSPRKTFDTRKGPKSRARRLEASGWSR